MNINCSSVQKSYCQGDETVPEPRGAGSDAAVPSARRQQAELFVAGVVGVFNDPVSLLPTPLGVEVLHEWQHRHGDVLCSFPNPL